LLGVESFVTVAFTVTGVAAASMAVKGFEIVTTMLDVILTVNVGLKAVPSGFC
jgi:hypothetical protein